LATASERRETGAFADPALLRATGAHFPFGIGAPRERVALAFLVAVAIAG